MAIPGFISIANSQQRWKDCYAPAPKIDLTLRCNGEERVKILTSQGIWVNAGIDAPTVAPTVSTGGAGSFAVNKYWEYRYVYVVKTGFPLVENATTGGGSSAPRSNPSPKAAANSTVNTNLKTIAIPTSQASDVSHIWLYRTNYFLTAQEAQDNSTGGVLFWIGEGVNDPNAANITFSDNGTIVGQEQIENDNFLAPQFQFCVFADPFFYGFGNNPIDLEVVFTVTGAVSNPVGFRWYDGRNGQIASLKGITSGGFDNKGNFYIKFLSATTAQLYTDIALTFAATLTISGVSMLHIRGPSTVLYRSKARNPFSWGFTDIVGTINVPQLYAFSVGGGRGTALSIVPNFNFLKLDTEAPNKVYSMNLKNAGTPNFEASLRSFADNYAVSVHHSQFTATVENGMNVLWGLDTKSKSIVECDGSNQLPMSNPVFRTLKAMSVAAGDRLYYHGGYHPRLELNCLFLRTSGVQTSINRILYMHGPTKQWGIVNCFDILCSSQILNPITNELMLFVGTQSGLVGELFAENKILNWYVEDPLLVPNDIGLLHGTFDVGNTIFTFDTFVYVAVPNGLVGNWVALSVAGTSSSPFVFFARVASATLTTITIDSSTLLDSTLNVVLDFSLFPSIRYMWIGWVECKLTKVFNGQVPFALKKLEEIWTTWRKLVKNDPTYTLDVLPPSIEVFPSFGDHYVPIASTSYIPLIQKEDSNWTGAPDFPNTPEFPSGNAPNYEGQIFGLERGFGIDLARTFGIIIHQRNYGFAQLLNYELRLTDESNVHQR